MKYSNFWYRKNRGLVVFLIDQSNSMSASSLNRQSLAEIAADAVNLMLNNFILSSTSTDYDGDVKVKNRATIVVIGYGGKDNDNAECLFCESITKIDEDFPRVPINIAAKEGNVTLDCIQALKSKVGYGTPMASAFKLAKDTVDTWISIHNNMNDPVPVVVNIAGSYPTDSEEDVRKYANEIKNMEIPDGNVLLFNVHIPREIIFPANGELMSDKITQLLCDISSNVSHDLIKNCYQSKSNIQPGSKLFINTIYIMEHLFDKIDFLSYDGAVVSKMKCI